MIKRIKKTRNKEQEQQPENLQQQEHRKTSMDINLKLYDALICLVVVTYKGALAIKPVIDTCSMEYVAVFKLIWLCPDHAFHHALTMRISIDMSIRC